MNKSAASYWKLRFLPGDPANLRYNMNKSIKPKPFIYGIYSKGACKETQKGGALIKNSEIVNMYWDRNENAIHQTQMKYGAYLSG